MIKKIFKLLLIIIILVIVGWIIFKPEIKKEWCAPKVTETGIGGYCYKGLKVGEVVIFKKVKMGIL